MAQIAELAGTDPTHAHRIVNKLPDAYIDRWLKTGKRFAAVGQGAKTPSNC